MGHQTLKQIMPATPGWYCVFKEDTGGYVGCLISAWGLIKEKQRGERILEPDLTYAVPLSPEGCTGQLRDWSMSDNFEAVVFRPQWFRQATTNYVTITHFDPDKDDVVTD